MEYEHNKRRERRYLIMADALIKRLDEKKPAHALAVNVNHGGIYLFTKERLLLGELCEVEFTLVEGKRVITKPILGEVRWVARDEKLSDLGIEFMEKLDENEDESFYKCVDYAMNGAA